MLAVELYFDPATEEAVKGLLRDLKAANLPSPLLDQGVRPHVSLVVAETVDDALKASIQGLAEGMPPILLALTSVGAFPGEEGAVFLAPASRARLLELHHNVHELCATHVEERNPRYVPGSWVPHCTLSTGLSPKQAAQAVYVMLKAPLPIEGRFTEIGLHDAATGEYPYCFPLTEQASRA